MALQKNINLPNGSSGNYVRIVAYSWDRIRREASAHFSLFTTAAQAAAAPGAPLVPIIAKLRLRDDKFDEFLSNAVLDAGGTVVSQLYAAAKAEPLISGGGLPAPSLGLAAVNLADAEDV